jgi:hypothetical protein
MKRRTGLAAVLVLFLSACGPPVVNVREPWPTDPAGLAVFLGSWSVEGEMRPDNAYGVPAGRYAYVETYDWRPGEFLLQMDRDGQGPGGEIRHTFTLGYHLTTRSYSLMGTDLTTGVVSSGAGTNDGDVWRFQTVAYLGNLEYVHERCTVTVASPRTYTMQCEASPDGTTWSPAYDAKATRS